LVKFIRNERRGYKENRFRVSRPPVSSPVKVGEEYQVAIEDMSKRGDSGVTRIGGIVVFVDNTNIGDSVKIRIVTVGDRYATGKVLDQSEKSGDLRPNLMQVKTDLSLVKLAETSRGKEIFGKFASSFRETRDLTQALDSAVNCAKANGSLADFQGALINDIFVILRPFIGPLVVEPEKKSQARRDSRFSARRDSRFSARRDSRFSARRDSRFSKQTR